MTEPRKRVRLRSIEHQLQKALNDSEELSREPLTDLAAVKMRFLQTRTRALLRMQGHKNREEVRTLETEITQLKNEITRLQAELAALAIKPVRPLSEVEIALAAYEKEKAEKTEGGL